MTIDERFERLMSAEDAERWRKAREEDRQLLVDTQRQIDKLSRRVADTNATITRLAEESRDTDRRLGERIDRLAEESREADRQLGERIDALVSATGVYISKSPKSES